MNAKLILLAVAVAVIGAGALMMCDDSEAATGDVLKSGNCGTSLTCEVRSLNADDSQVEVVISGSGTVMQDWSIGTYAPWYSYKTKIISVTLPEGLTSIGAFAFYDCQSLALTSLPEGLTSIGTQAFYNCQSLALTSLPEGLTSIGNSAFTSCRALALTSLPEGLTSIEDYTFRYCRALALTSLPEGLTSIGTQAFDTCPQIKSLKMPAIALSTNIGLSNLETLTYSTTGEVWTASNAQYSPQYLSRATLQSITFSNDNIPSFALYSQNLDTLTITNASGPDYLGIYTAPNVKATASALTVDGTAAQIVRLTDVRGAAELLDGGINLNDVDVHWDTSPHGYATGEVDASPEVLVYPAGIHTSAPNQYAGLINAIPLIVIVAIVMTIIGMMAVRRD